jgi:predicted O-methyltransferase YrrM
MSSLRSEAVTTVLDRIYATGEGRDDSARQRFLDRRAEQGGGLSTSEAADVYRDAPLAVRRPIGELLHVLALARGAKRIVEFGTSFGASTIYLAAALRDAGGGHLITTEIHPEKARTAERNLSDARLADLVEVRIGNALETLRGLTEPIDLVFLDGFGELYLPVLRILEPQISRGAPVAADASAGSGWRDYEAYVRSPTNGYVSTRVPLDHGVEVSVRTGPS